MVIFTGYSPSSQLNIKHMYALAFSRTCDTVFFTCSSLNHDKFMFKVPFWNHTSGGACPKTPYIQGNQDKRFSVSAFSYTHRFKNLFIYGINSKNFARLFLQAFEQTRVSRVQIFRVMIPILRPFSLLIRFRDRVLSNYE